MRGILRSADGKLQRNCSVTADRHEMHVNEKADPVKVSYSMVSIADSDDWPDGDYELTYDGEKEMLTKKDGRYFAKHGIA